MAQTKKKKKRRSQAPIALVYFITMIIFLVIIGLVSFYMLKKTGVLFGDDDKNKAVSENPTYNTFLARVNSKNVLVEMTIVRVAPDAQKIVVIPVSAFTVNESGKTLREVYEAKGIKSVENAVEKMFGMTFTNYATVSNTSFETICDIIGGIAYAPDEELYYLSQDNDENDISLPAGELSQLSGRQIRLICQYPVFKEGRGGNMKFLGTAVSSLINNAFQQSTLTKDNLDNIYDLIVTNSSTDWTKEQWIEEKMKIRDMLDMHMTPAVALVPEGEWTDEMHFKINDEYFKSVDKMLSETAGSVVETSSQDAE